LSNELEDANFAKRKEIGRILWQLTKAVIDRRKDILASLKTLAQFDLTFAKAQFSLDYQMSPPAINPEPSMNLRHARHPLLVNCVSIQKACSASEAINQVVPIDVRLGEDFDLLLVTGPNTGGKTVMLKTIGLLTLMAQSGMHIPAHPDSQLGIFRKIFADIGDEQSIQQNLSTFSAHISQIVHILKMTNEKTLVLLDELGAGTDPVEGAVLATAILDKLLSRGGKTIATTHLGRLKSYAYATPRTENASVQFDSETLKPTYVLRIGTPGSSNALAIAERLEMPKAVVKKAKSLLQRDPDGTSDLINQVQTTREDAEQKRLDAQEILDQAKELHSNADKRLEQLKHQEKMVTDQANREIDKSMTEVRAIVEDFIKQMRNAPKPWSQHTEQLNQKIIKAAESTPLAVRQTQFIQTLRKGDTVYVIPFRRNGIVDRINQKRRTITLLLEGKQLRVPFTEVWEPDNK
jgi:DNA mismatch repair protein MutS2